jgi:DNA-binding ferritin-like protein (Dps family)
MEEVGQIWLEFWTINYNTARLITVKDDLGNEVPMPFRGTDFKDIGLKLKLDIGASADYSETLVMSTLDKLFDKGSIDTKTYVELAPDSVMPFKQDLLKKLEQLQTEQMQQQQLMQNMQQLPQPNSVPQTPQIM